MRRVILSMHMSLDGFVAGPKNEMNWMQPDSDEEWDDMFAMWQNVDLVLVGRGMWKEYRDYWSKALTEPGFPPNEVRYARLALHTKHLIFSDSLKKTGWTNATVCHDGLKKTIKRLKQEPGKDIIVFGGARFASSLIDSGLVDEYRLLIEPTILAKGKSIFKKHKNMHGLGIIELKKMQNGVAVARYVQIESTKASKGKSKKVAESKPA